MIFHFTWTKFPLTCASDLNSLSALIMLVVSVSIPVRECSQNKLTQHLYIFTLKGLFGEYVGKLLFIYTLRNISDH